MSNYDIITEYELYLKVEKKYSINTINTYITNISSFSEFVNKNFKNVEEEDIKKYLMYLNKNNISEKSVANKISSLKSFYKYLIIE